MPDTIERVLRAGIDRLRPSSDSARFDALLLLEHQLGRPREWILAHGDSTLDSRAAEQFAQRCALRAEGTPIAYIVGDAGFYGRRFVVSEAVLVPRPETEHVVEAALEFLHRSVQPVVNVLDVGTGSGAIACTIAAEDPRVRVTAVDICADALAIAERNAHRLGVQTRCRFACGDLAEPVDGRRFDVVVANLPYVPTGEVPRKPHATGFEPRLALDGGTDGLELYRRLLPAAPALLEPESLLLLEAAPPQMPQLLALVADAFPHATPICRDDYGGRGRYVWLRTGAP